MSVSTIRGGRGRGRGGYRPIRRLSYVESSKNADDNQSDDDEKISNKITLPPKFSLSMPIASQTVLSSPHPSRKPINIFNITSQSHITQVDTSKLMEQLKVSSSRISKNEDNGDERMDDEKPRCEFCASVDHLTRNCFLFKPPPNNACYNCKEIGHYKNHCPKRAERSERSKFSNYRGQSFRSGVKAYGSRSGTSLKWNASPVINDATEDEEDDESTTANTNSVGDKHMLTRPARINVPMPVPASSIKPAIQLRSKIKSTDSPCVKQSPAVISQSKTSSYIRSDTEDEFSSSSGDEKETSNDFNNVKGANSHIKDKFDLSLVNQMIKSPITPSEFAKKFMGSAQRKQHKSVFRETILPLILKDTASKIEEEEKEIAEQVQGEKAASKSMMETVTIPGPVDDNRENPKSVASKIRQNPQALASSESYDRYQDVGKAGGIDDGDVQHENFEETPVEEPHDSNTNQTVLKDQANNDPFEFCDNEMLSDVDEDFSQINADIEFYGCDGAILSENDSELQEKSDRDKVSVDESDASNSESTDKE